MSLSLPVLRPIPLEEDEAERSHSPTDDRHVLEIVLQDDLHRSVSVDTPHHLPHEPKVRIDLVFEGMNARETQLNLFHLEGFFTLCAVPNIRPPIKQMLPCGCVSSYRMR